MEKFKLGDVVARKSYNYDVIFKIVGINNNREYELCGLTVRIVADSPEEDLKHISSDEVEKRIKTEEKSRRERLSRCYSNIHRKFNNMNYYNKNKMYMNNMNNVNNNINKNYYIRDPYEDDPNIFKKDTVLKKPGVVLHIDGDPEYTEKCREAYRKMGLTVYAYNIPESEQYRQVYSLLQKIRPNILILTGHDAFFKRRNDIYNIDNYKNSKYYIQAVLEARRYEHNLDNLVIFAGACQSYYEAIISARC